MNPATAPQSAQDLLLENQSLRRDASRYRWLRERDLDTIHMGGVFAGLIPENVVLNGADLDKEIDAAMASTCNDRSKT